MLLPVIFSIMLVAVHADVHRQFNYTNLIFQYFLVCGPEHFCRIDDFLFPVLPNQQYNISSCPTCSCDDLCISRGDCCPDLYFALPFQTCVNVTLIEATNIEDRKQNSQHLMVNTCPQNTDPEIRRKCEGNDLIERFQYLPVTSINSPLTYYNKYCALCNGETNVTDWSLDFACAKFSDFNFVSTFEELVRQAIERQCVIQSFPEEVQSKVHTCFEEEIKFYNICNRTKLWKDFDFDIQYGCEKAYFKRQFRFFDSIFCYICNPSHISESYTEKCNTTGVWYPFDLGLANACSYYPGTHATFPYKNIFCYLCNRNNFQNNQFVDVGGNITEQITRKVLQDNSLKEVFLYDLKLDSFKKQYLKIIIERMVSQSPDLQYIGLLPPYSNIFTTTDGRNINFTNLMLKYMSLGESKICQKSILPEEIQNKTSPCSCSSNCQFTGETWKCCIDTALRYPGKCINQHLHENIDNDGIEYYVTNGCYNKEHFPEVFKAGCIGNGTDIFSTFPLNDLSSNVLYINFFCFLCNHHTDFEIKKNFDEIDNTATLRSNIPEQYYDNGEHYTVSISFDKFFYDPWDLDIECDIYLDYQHYLLVSELISTLKTMPCKIDYILIPGGEEVHSLEPSFTATKCPYDTSYKRCNKTGKWTKLDDDVNWACSDVSKGSTARWIGYEDIERTLYKNEFCGICNPPKLVQPTIDVCNVTGHWTLYDIDMDKACKYFPYIDYFSPYKNFFCWICNGGDTRKSIGDSGGIEKNIYVPFPRNHRLAIFRNIFSLSAYEDTDDGESNVDNCANYQIYDSSLNSCRNITCYPGKYRCNSTCVALLPRTSALRYTLAVGFNGKVNGTITTLEMMNDIIRVITLNLTQQLHLVYNPIVNYYIMANQQCLYQTQMIDANEFEGIALISVFIQEVVYRVETETSLLKFLNSNITDKRNGLTYSLKLKRSQEAYYLPLRKYKSDFKNQCFQYNITGPTLSSIPYEQYRLITASKIMICEQIELLDNEFEVSYNDMQLHMRKTGAIFDNDDFDILPNGYARICMEKYNNVNAALRSGVKNATNYEYIIWIFTLLCIILSLFCLLLTFFIYCKFGVLRSVPGKTNMNLVAVLFFTMLLYQVGMDKIHYPAICICLGIILHYFWLTSFTAMQMCCFHMYSSFHSNYVKTLEINKQFVYYCLYMYGTPAVVVLTHVCTRAGISFGREIGYGGVKCFISGKNSFIISFLTPVIIICVTNIFFFVSSVRTIKNTPKIRSNKNERDEFRIFAKLFTVTGISWLFQILDAFLPLSPFSVIIAILNALQGFFIFLAFICNRRILNLFKMTGMCKRSNYRPGTDSKSTTETSFKE